MAAKLFVDTWGWVTVSNIREARHQQVSAFLHAFRGRVYTTDFVLDETITLLYARYPHSAERAVQRILDKVQHGSFIQEPITAARFETAWRFRQRYADKPAISFTDLTSMVVIQELGIVEILTNDAHFTHVGLGFLPVPAAS